MRRAVVQDYGGPEVLSVEHSGSAMLRPRANQLRIRVLASSINPGVLAGPWAAASGVPCSTRCEHGCCLLCAVDCWMMRGYGRQLFPLAGIAPPFTTGRDLVGEVVELGPLAWRYARGDIVAAALHPTREGAHADFVNCCESGEPVFARPMLLPFVRRVPTDSCSLLCASVRPGTGRGGSYRTSRRPICRAHSVAGLGKHGPGQGAHRPGVGLAQCWGIAP